MGADIDKAVSWSDGKPPGARQLTELHRDYIHASQNAKERRDSVDRQRVRLAVIALLVGFGLALLAVGAAGFGMVKARESSRLSEENLEEQVKAVASAEEAVASAEEALRELQTRQEREQSSLRSWDVDTLARFGVVVGPASTLQQICLAASDVVGSLATTDQEGVWRGARVRFWELYYGPMYLVETHQRKRSPSSRSPIEQAMVQFGDHLNAASLSTLPASELCAPAVQVFVRCQQYTGIEGSPMSCP